ncbi:MAG: VOC family protein [Patescibacteria group bacterium]|nr:VOC family protein [Patescibacteria group bacterium]
MSSISANPYINFQGKAREALEFYSAALGGKIDLLAATPDGPPKVAGPDDRIMHGAVTADGLLIMGSDGHPDYPPTIGDTMAVALSGSDRERITLAFEKLSEGGTVKQPLKQESWGDTFGYFVDKFGINWMVNIYEER